MTVVAFDPYAFKAAYPAFCNVPVPTLSFAFQQAGLYLTNTDCSPVQNVAKRTILLWMLTAHIAALGGATDPSGQPMPVGRASNATEGSVSVAFAYSADNAQAWFDQTQYGAAFWQATLSLRQFRYIPAPPQRNVGLTWPNPGRLL